MQNTTNFSSDGDLQTFESLLDKKLEVARKGFSSLKNRLADLERQAEKIHDLKLALARITDRTFVEDPETVQLIPKARLMAMPAAMASIEEN